MKKIFVFAAIAALAFTACQKGETESVSNNQTEITAVGFNKVMTKGYTAWASAGDGSATTDFTEVEDPENPTPATPREMQLSVYEQTVGDLFVDVTFAKNTTDGIWHATPAKYYPLGGSTFDFLAYSVGESANKIGVWDGAQKVSFQVTDAFFQDDILYGAASNASKTAPTDMTFEHAQAWINMNLNLTKESSPSAEFKVNSITWKNVKSQGKLYIEGNAGTATATWDFFGLESNEVEMDDAQDVLENELAAPADASTDGEPSKLNMLLPAQNGATGFVINYTIGGQTFDYEYKLDSAAEWEMGHKYIYNIHITINEITVAPKVVEFVVETPVEINF